MDDRKKRWVPPSQADLARQDIKTILADVAAVLEEGGKDEPVGVHVLLVSSNSTKQFMCGQFSKTFLVGLLEEAKVALCLESLGRKE